MRNFLWNLNFDLNINHCILLGSIYFKLKLEVCKFIPLTNSVYFRFIQLNSVKLLKKMLDYSLAANRHPPHAPLINISKFFHPGHSYSNPLGIRVVKVKLEYHVKFSCLNCRTSWDVKPSFEVIFSWFSSFEYFWMKAI